ncbi:hypothetical protein C0989_006055 [Termitomyces sp. Mn162]|nr:hypothetical protein C0989_006055 [Termitomyces sp. Mn162]
MKGHQSAHIVMHAHYVDMPHTLHKTALHEQFFPISTPLMVDCWLASLEATCHDPFPEYPDLFLKPSCFPTAPPLQLPSTPLTFIDPWLSGSADHEDALDHRPDPNVFSTLATLLHAVVLALDTLPAHLPSHSSTTLFLRTTLPFSDNSIPTLVNSGTTDNFIDKALAVLAPHHL